VRIYEVSPNTGQVQPKASVQHDGPALGLSWSKVCLSHGFPSSLSKRLMDNVGRNKTPHMLSGQVGKVVGFTDGAAGAADCGA
jgi:hypothetical protein